MPAQRRRPPARRPSTSERRAVLVEQISMCVRKDSADEEIDRHIQALMFEHRPDWVWGMVFSYYVSSPALRTTKLSERQLKRLYRDIREQANA